MQVPNGHWQLVGPPPLGQGWQIMASVLLHLDMGGRLWRQFCSTWTRVADYGVSPAPLGQGWQIMASVLLNGNTRVGRLWRQSCSTATLGLADYGVSPAPRQHKGWTIMASVLLHALLEGLCSIPLPRTRAASPIPPTSGKFL